MAFDSSTYINQFAKENYDRLAIQVPKGGKAVLKEISERTGKSINKLVIEAIEEKYDIDLTRKI